MQTNICPDVGTVQHYICITLIEHKHVNQGNRTSNSNIDLKVRSNREWQSIRMSTIIISNEDIFLSQHILQKSFPGVTKFVGNFEIVSHLLPNGYLLNAPTDYDSATLVLIQASNKQVVSESAQVKI